MLSEEEKEAIERLEEQLNFWKKQNIKNIKNSNREIILNLINRLKKENEVKDKQIKDLQSRKDNQEKRFKKYKENIDKKYEEIYEYLEKISQDLDNVAIDQIPIAIAELKCKNQLKDKQIDLMAEYWNTGLAMCDNCDKIIEKYEENTCKECIKQYFENKAKKGE